MGLRDWFKRPPPSPAPPAGGLNLSPEQRGPTTIQYAGLIIQLPFKWDRATGADTEPGAEEYHNAVLSEQLFIIPRPFVRRVTPDELRTQLLSLAQHQRSALESKLGDRVTIGPPDLRTGGDQVELRILARAPDLQVAALHRGDPGRIVSISLYRYIDASKLNLREYAGNVFDLVQFEPTPA